MKRPVRAFGWCVALVLCLSSTLALVRAPSAAEGPAPDAIAPTAAPSPGTVRRYYIAADEIDWNYMPTGRDGMMGMAPMGYAKLFAQKTPQTIGPVYRKAVYREYTDATFTHLKARPPSQAYLGLLGPVLHAEVGDTIVVVFRNHGTHPYSMHPHGVFYEKASEGSPYADGVPEAAKGGASVAPGGTFTYVWQVPERAGPGPNDPSSILWFYHSHVDERRDVNAGLIGGIVVTRKGMARPDGTPKDVDREFLALLMIFDENQSVFINDNIKRFIKKPEKNLKFDGGSSLDPEGNNDPFGGRGFASLNFRFTVNGYSFANMPMPVMKRGEHIRWYAMTLGEGLNNHTAHWHGNTVIVNGNREDVISLMPAQVAVADMVPDNPGIWMFHCHVSEHMAFGMSALYRVLP